MCRGVNAHHSQPRRIFLHFLCFGFRTHRPGGVPLNSQRSVEDPLRPCSSVGVQFRCAIHPFLCQPEQTSGGSLPSSLHCPHAISILVWELSAQWRGRSWLQQHCQSLASISSSSSARRHLKSNPRLQLPSSQCWIFLYESCRMAEPSICALRGPPRSAA